MFETTPIIKNLAEETLSLSTPRGRLFALGTIFGVLFALGPKRLERSPNLCIYRKLLGRPCPACGTGRAAASLLRGQPRRAAHYNWLIFPAFAVLFFNTFRDLQRLRKSSDNTRFI